MRRLARRLLTLCRVLSLVLCVAVCVLWTRSRRTVDVAEVQYAGYSLTAATMLDYEPTPGGLSLQLCNAPGADRFRFTWGAASIAQRPHVLIDQSQSALPAIELHGGFGYQRRDVRHVGLFGSPAQTLRLAVVPLWPVALATAVLPACRAAHRVRRRQRSRAGLCRSCGYDLRASPERCPECGAIAAGR